MAEPKPADAKPTLVAVGPEKKATPDEPVASRATPAAAEATDQSKRSRWGLWLLLLLLLAAVASAFVQTQRLADSNTRVTALSEQVVGLEAQLSAAHTQISTYEMQRGQIREAVSDISQRVLLLGELVGGESPLAEPTPEP